MERADLSFDVKNLVEDSVFSSAGPAEYPAQRLSW